MLGRRDLVLLFVVAVFNLNVVPSIAANGGVTIWLWLISLLLFSGRRESPSSNWPTVIRARAASISGRKKCSAISTAFFRLVLLDQQHAVCADGDAVLRRRLGVRSRPRPPGAGRQQDICACHFAGLLALLTVFNIVGLGVGKWLNNLGAIGTAIAAAVLIGLGIMIWLRYGTTITAADFRVPADPRFVLNSFGVICFGLVGLELASVMGDEIRDPARTFPGAVAWGGVISGTALHRRDADAADRGGQERHQRAARHRAGGEPAWRRASVWLDHRAICLDAEPFDRRHWFGMDRRLGPNSFRRRTRFLHAVWLGKVHPRYATPYAALIVQAIVFAILVILNFLPAPACRKRFRSCCRWRWCCSWCPFCICSPRC